MLHHLKPLKLMTVLAAMSLAACGLYSSEEKKNDGPPPPPPPWGHDTGLLPNGNLEGDNTNLWGIYDNAADAGFTGGSPVDCTADGFTGNCLKGSATHWFGTALWDSAVYLNKGTSAENLFVTLAPGTYRVSFKAKASQAVTAHVVMQTAGYVASLSEDIALGTSLQTYESSPFDVAASTDLSFGIQLGIAANDGATIEFDDIKLLVKD